VVGIQVGVSVLLGDFDTGMDGIIVGTSVGALVGALLGTHTKDATRMVRESDTSLARHREQTRTSGTKQAKQRIRKQKTS